MNDAKWEKALEKAVNNMQDLKLCSLMCFKLLFVQFIQENVNI